MSVSVYSDEAAAASAARSPEEARFADCIIGAIKKWFPAAGYDVSERQSYEPLKASSIRTSSHPIGAGHELRLTSGQFDEELLGGSDNTHDIAEVTGRSGPVVVTTYYATNSQGGDPARTQALAQRVTVAALERARRELRSQPRGR